MYVNNIIECPSPTSIMDGFCNDEINIPECFYDGGDCCKNPVWNDLCTECKCI